MCTTRGAHGEFAQLGVKHGELADRRPRRDLDIRGTRRRTTRGAHGELAETRRRTTRGGHRELAQLGDGCTRRTR